MKKIIVSIIVTLTCILLSAAKWQTFTNTSHVYDLMVQGSDVYISSWGGVMQLAPPAGGSLNSPLQDMVHTKTWTTADGLSSNDVRNMEYIGLSQSLWFGSAFDGISIVNPLGVQQLNTTLGLPSNRVTKIVEYGSEIIVATANGLSSYYYLEGVNFPLMLHQYTVANTGGGLLSNAIDSMVLAANNYLYLSSTAGINYVHLDSLAVDSAWHHFLNPPSGTGSVNKLSLNSEKLVIAVPAAVVMHSINPWQDGWEVADFSDGLLGTVVSSACLDEQNTLWVSYGEWDENFLRYSRDADTLMTTITSMGTVRHWTEFEAGLRDKSISQIVHYDGKIYLCTWGDGVFRNDGGDSWSQFQPNSLGFPNIRNIITDSNNAVWFSSGNLNHLPLKKSALGASKYLEGNWQNFTIANSPIHTDNIMCVAVDSHNRKWFGTYDVNPESPEGWMNGVAVWDEKIDVWKLFTRSGIKIRKASDQDWSAVVPGSPHLMGNTDVYISRDMNGNMFVSCFDDGFSVFDPYDNLIGEFTIPNSVYQRSIFSYHNGRQYFFGTFNDNGLVIWNDNSIPVTDGDHWEIPEPSELSNCEVYGVVTVESPYEGTQHWVAASNGLFMWDEQDWYKWDTSIKRFIYNSGTGLWDDDLLYYADEERLYGSVRTTPTAIMLDPFNRVWIGSLEHGISMYDPGTERFTNYFKENSPLLSDYITALGYQPVEGLLLVGTPDGLNTLSIGRSIKPETTLQTLKIYPNPFYPDTGDQVQITNLPSDLMPSGNNQCRIYDSSGALIRDLDENEFSRFVWDGNNGKGKKCASGVYYVVVTDKQGKRLTGKIAILR